MPTTPRLTPDADGARWAGKNVLVTGGLGFMGSNLAHRLVREGASVTVLDNLDQRAGGNRANLLGIEGQVQVLEGDVRDADVLSTLVPRHDVVFHCAAVSGHVQAMREPLANLEVLGEGTLRILEAARRAPRPPKIVHVGTTTQLGATGTSPAAEDRREAPRDIYSAHKALAEKYALIYHEAYGVPNTVVRLGNVYGPRACIRSAELGFVNYFIGLGLQNKDLTVFGPGDQLRSLTYVDDAVDALVRAAASSIADGQVFHAAAWPPHPLKTIASTIARVIGGRVTNVPWPPERSRIEVGDAVVDSSKIQRELQWEARVRLEDGLAMTRDFYAVDLAPYLEVVA